MNEKMLRRYANMLATVGINVQKGQKVLVEACIEGYQFANIFAQECYKCGAGEVIINYLDLALLKTKALYQSIEDVTTIANWEKERYESALESGACTIRLEGVNPKLMEDLSETKASAVFSYIDNMRNIMRKAAREKHCQWCIAMVPSYEWATLLFPQLSADDALDKLWDTLFKLCYLTEDNDIVQVWKDKNVRKQALGKKLDELNLKSLHYTASNGTDLTVELTPYSKFAREKSDEGIPFNANIPTEEICTSPYKFGTNGVVYATRPLLLGGKVIENFGFRFKDGQVVEVLANEGKEMLENLINTDENAKYLGECALVEYDSPISQSGLVYYTTLIDENASCHLALGRALNNSVQYKDVFNDSSIHIDFMIGSKDMNIKGTTQDGQVIDIFVDGNFAI